MGPGIVILTGCDEMFCATLQSCTKNESLASTLFVIVGSQHS